MIKVHNTSPQDLTIARGITIPKHGSLDVHPDALDAAMNSGAVQSWVNRGWLVPHHSLEAAMRPAIIPDWPDGDHSAARGAGGEGRDAEPGGAGDGAHGAAPALSDDERRGAAMERAEALGIKFNDRWKTETIEKRVAEAEAE